MTFTCTITKKKFKTFEQALSYRSGQLELLLSELDSAMPYLISVSNDLEMNEEFRRNLKSRVCNLINLMGENGKEWKAELIKRNTNK